MLWKRDFSADVDLQLHRAAKLHSFPKYHALVSLLINEMTIKEDLVYDKHAGTPIGFVNLGDIINHLLQFEESLDEESQPVLAKSVIV